MVINNPILFWTAFGAIGTTAGAIATAIAVIVALWQVKHAEKKKLRLVFSDDMKMVTEGSSEIEETVIRLRVVNVGNRDVVVETWGYRSHEKGGYMVLGFNQSRLMKNLNPKLPCELKKEDSLNLMIERANFIKQIKNGVDSVDFKKNRKIRFFVADSTGKEYYVKSKKTVGEIIKS